MATAFGELFDDGIVEILRNMEIYGPNEVQGQALKLAVEGRDILVVAQTGSGKTLTFLLPILRLLSQGASCEQSERPALDALQAERQQAQQSRSRSSPEFLVVVPSRELVVQHTAVAERLAEALPDPLAFASHVVIATAETVLAEQRAGLLSLEHVRAVAMDEADALLCAPQAWEQALSAQGLDLLGVLQRRESCQLLLACAHLSEAHEKVIEEHLPGLAQVRQAAPSGGSRQAALVPTLRQRFHYFNAVFTPKDSKFLSVLRAAAEDEFLRGGTTVVFCDSVAHAEHVHALLQQEGFSRPALLHAEIDDEEHRAAILAFRSAEARVLVATDVAARGLDFPLVRHVVMYDLGSEVLAFVHCVGRTARRGQAGVVDCLVPSGADAGQFRVLHALQAAEPLSFPTKQAK